MELRERFQERDLRAKVVSESASLVEASERLGHTDTGITQRVYRPNVGIREVEDPIWLVSFLDYDLGFFDGDEEFLKLKIIAAFLPPLPRNANINPHVSA